MGQYGRPPLAIAGLLVTTGPVFVFGPVTAVLFGRIQIHYSAHYSARIEYE